MPGQAAAGASAAPPATLPPVPQHLIPAVKPPPPDHPPPGMSWEAWQRWRQGEGYPPGIPPNEGGEAEVEGRAEAGTARGGEQGATGQPTAAPAPEAAAEGGPAEWQWIAPPEASGAGTERVDFTIVLDSSWGANVLILRWLFNGFWAWDPGLEPNMLVLSIFR